MGEFCGDLLPFLGAIVEFVEKKIRQSITGTDEQQQRTSPQGI